MMIQLLFRDFDSKQVHFELSNDECGIGLACRCLKWAQTWIAMEDAFSKTVLEQMLPSVKNVIAMCS